MDLIRIHAKLVDAFGPVLTVVDLFGHPNIKAVTAKIDGDARRRNDIHLNCRTGAQALCRAAPRSSHSRQSGDGMSAAGETEGRIAIIGMAGRFPGAQDITTFWRNLCNGVESVTFFTDDQLEDGAEPSTRASASYVKARPVLPDVDQFDAGFFDMRDREAALTDPQHRVFLECAWEALEDAGYDSAAYRGAIGVFAGCSMNTYFLNNVCRDRKAIEDFTDTFQVGDYPVLMGAGREFLATRVSYKLDLRGPALTIQTACSTSLVAVAQACQSLLLYQSDMALAGGASISFPQHRGYLHQEGGMVSADGHCRPFDASASGTIFGSGAGVVLLKRLEDAIADGDQIYGVILGCGLSNDGAGKVGFTAPSVDGQVAAIEQALAQAGVAADSISYVECHGTATPLGDPIEVAALTKAFRKSSRGARLLRYRFGQGKHRPPRRRGGRGWPDQDSPDAPQPRARRRA